MEDGGDQKEARREPAKVHRHAIVVQPVLVAADVARGPRVSPRAIVPRRPDRLIVHVHLHRGHLRDAVDGHPHVLALVGERVEPMAPVAHVQREAGHERVHDEADQVGPPDPLRRRQPHAPAAKGHAQVANLVDHARVGNAMLVYRRRVDGKHVGSVDGHHLEWVLATPAARVHLRPLRVVVLVKVVILAIGANGALFAAAWQKLVLFAIVRMRHVLAPAAFVVVRNRIGSVEERAGRGHRARLRLLAPRRRGGRLRRHVAGPALLIEQPHVGNRPPRLHGAVRLRSAASPHGQTPSGLSGTRTRERRPSAHPQIRIRVAPKPRRAPASALRLR